jgi:Flp pilus assembly protein TadG
MTAHESRVRSCLEEAPDEELGQALVELAISLPLLLLLLFGAVQFGRLAYMAIEVSDAAKAAAQYGAQNGTTAIDGPGITLAAQKSAPYVSNNCSNFSANVTSPVRCSCITSGAPASGDPSTATCSSTTCAGYIVKVLEISTTASCDPGIHIPNFPGSITLNGSAVQEVLN